MFLINNHVQCYVKDFLRFSCCVMFHHNQVELLIIGLSIMLAPASYVFRLTILNIMLSVLVLLCLSHENDIS